MRTMLQAPLFYACSRITRGMAGAGESAIEIGFVSAKAADRQIAGVSAAARAIKALVDDEIMQIRLLVADGTPLAPGTRADIARLSGKSNVVVVRGEGPTVLLPSGWQVIRQTGKASDGIVSRWLNRPLSQRISWALLELFPSVRPYQVTIFNALLALLLIPVLALGGATGLLFGGILFHASSVLDGVDGEIARATWRTSTRGATLDSIVDIATNLLFVAGLTINLALRDGGLIGWVGAWSLTLSIVGGTLIASFGRSDRAIGFDLLKRRGHQFRGIFDVLFWIAQTLTGRDCFAFLYLVLIIVGLERIALGIYAGVGTIWLVYVVIMLTLSRMTRASSANIVSADARAGADQARRVEPDPAIVT